MRTPKHSFDFRQKVLVIALLAAIDPAMAADDEVTKLIKPDSEVLSIGLGASAGDKADRTLFGQYNGWRKNSAGLLLDYELIERDDATGLWTNIDLSNLGLDNRELSLSQQKQGEWKLGLHYSEQVRHDPRTITTGSGATQELELKRKGLSLNIEQRLDSRLTAELSFKNENKSGARLFGVGNYCSNIISGYSCSTTVGAFLLTPEQIDSNTQQFDAKLNFAGDALLLSGGYYGSFYKNSNNTLTPSVTAVNAELGAYLSQPVALAPDNQAHQFYAQGNYTFTPTTRANFNASYTQAKQTGSFGTLAVAGAPDNLGGKLNRTFMQVGLTARPVQKLSLLADWRYENVQDDTPLNSFGNTPTSQEKDNGKIEASYQLPDNYRITAGLDYAYVKRARPAETTIIPPTSLTALREETAELSGRFEVKRSMSDTLNAALSISHSKRDGGHWTGLVPDATGPYPVLRANAFAAVSSTGTVPFTMTNRSRDKVRLLADWAATEQLALQFIIEEGKDEFTAPTTAGLSESSVENMSIDSSFSLSDQWKLTAYANYSTQTLNVGHSFGYNAALKNVSSSIGLGAAGKIDSKTEVGGTLAYLKDINRYDQLDAVPDVSYKTASLKLYGRFALDAQADVIVDVHHQRTNLSEWTWGDNNVPFTYTDGSVISVQPNQNLTFIGARYVYKLK